MPDPNSRLVYSTDGGRVIDNSEHRPARARAGQPSVRTTPPADGFIRIQREKKGRGGKTVTVVTGLPGAPRELDALLKDLKQHCGAGGTREGSVIEIQGDHRERLEARLVALGHQVKLAGG